MKIWWIVFFMYLNSEINCSFHIKKGKEKNQLKSLKILNPTVE